MLVSSPHRSLSVLWQRIEPYQSPAQGIAIATTLSGAVAAVAFAASLEEAKRDWSTRFSGVHYQTEVQSFTQEAMDVVLSLLECPALKISLRLELFGTAFRYHVWQTLRQIPAGQTMTYGQLARLCGQQNAVRAVASACGHNPVALLVPCHRVVRQGGQLGGFRWGLECKSALLQRERVERENQLDQFNSI